MDNNMTILLILLSYLTGAFPSAFIVGKSFFSIDIREHGSGNAGATNTFRVLGKAAGTIVLIIDVFKGWLVVNFVYLFPSIYINPELIFEYQLLFGVFAVVGHLFPVYTRFRGGKGIATLLGILIGLHSFSAFVSCIVFITVLLAFRYVSLASIFSAIAFPFIIYFFSESSDVSLIIFSIFVPLLALSTHHKNIRRLLRGQERKIKFK